MLDFLISASFLFVLLNPFLVVIYLVDIIEKLSLAQFSRVLSRAGVIAAAVFCFFAVLGDAVFTRVVQAEFASFQIFGGAVFFLIGLQFVFHGPKAIEILRGEAEHLSGAIAMPVLIGPGTISASVVIGKNQAPLQACLAVAAAVAASVALIIAFKIVHDHIRPRRERLVQRYIALTGRIMALFVGTIAVEMMMQGIRTWVSKF